VAGLQRAIVHVDALDTLLVKFVGFGFRIGTATNPPWLLAARWRICTRCPSRAGRLAQLLLSRWLAFPPPVFSSGAAFAWVLEAVESHSASNRSIDEAVRTLTLARRPNIDALTGARQRPPAPGPCRIGADVVSDALARHPQMWLLLKLLR
jgi:hypothetical protein